MLTNPQIAFLRPEYLKQLARPDVQRDLRGARIVRVCAWAIGFITVSYALAMAWVYAH